MLGWFVSVPEFIATRDVPAEAAVVTSVEPTPLICRQHRGPDYPRVRVHWRVVHPRTGLPSTFDLTTCDEYAVGDEHEVRRSGYSPGRAYIDPATTVMDAFVRPFLVGAAFEVGLAVVLFVVALVLALLGGLNDRVRKAWRRRRRRRPGARHRAGGRHREGGPPPPVEMHPSDQSAS